MAPVEEPGSEESEDEELDEELLEEELEESPLLFFVAFTVAPPGSEDS